MVSTERYKLSESPFTIFNTISECINWIEINKAQGNQVTFEKIIVITKE